MDADPVHQVQDVDESPSAKDLKAGMGTTSRRGLLLLGPATDAEHARRLNPVPPRDRGMRACHEGPDELMFANHRGTSGIASAICQWGRFGAMPVRPAHIRVGPRATPIAAGKCLAFPILG